LSLIPKGQSILADDLSTSASNCKVTFHPNRKYVFKIKHRPVVPNNVRYWQVFGSDKQLEIFLQLKDELECVHIDTDNDVYENKREIVLNETYENPEELEVLQLKDNVLPRGLVPLEELLEFNDVAKKKKIEPIGAKVEDCNIGTAKNPNS